MKKISVLIVLAVAVVGGYLYFTGRFNGISLPSPSVQPTATADNMLVVYEPLSGATATSPLTVRGKARGNWFFEASFPVILKDSAGHILAQKPAQAKTDWMTTDFVEFEVTLTFAKPTTATGTLILKKDNPSGLPQNDDSRQIPVTFK
jgi:hypothetical protein